MYYQWKLQQFQYPTPVFQIVSAQRNSLTPKPNTLNPQENQEFSRLLEDLNGSRDSIRVSFFIFYIKNQLGREWVVDHLQHSPTIAYICFMACDKAAEKTKKLHIVYLCNDVVYSV